MFGNYQSTILSYVCQSNISINWLQEILQQLEGDYSKCTMKLLYSPRGKRLQRVRNKKYFASWSTIRAPIFICQQPVGSTVLTSFTLFKFSGKYKMFGNYQSTILSYVCQSNISINWLQEILQQLEGDYSKCTMKLLYSPRGKRLQRVRNKNTLRLGAPSVRQSSLASFFSSLSTVPYSRKIQ